MSEKQIIISVGREFGSGGRKIAEELAKALDIKYYDKELLTEAARKCDIDVETIKKLQEKPSSLFSGMYISTENNVAIAQFRFMKQKAKEGESFVVLGRCAEHVLRENPNLISVFVTGDLMTKKEEVMKRYEVSANEAEALIYKTDKARKKYHNYYCDGKWGDSRNYDLCINSSELGIDGTVKVILEYVKNKK
jgi:cytidylate kinase